jgi:hypothetical protein
MTFCSQTVQRYLMGAGSDLQIYHDGSHSYITDNGTGSLLIQGSTAVVIEDPSGNNMAFFEDGGEAILYHNASARLTTKAAGVDITGGFTATDGCTITTADNSSQLTLISTDADGSSGPHLVLQRDSSSPADNDLLGQILFRGEDDGSNVVEACEMKVTARDVTNGTEDSQFDITTQVAGTARSRMVMNEVETTFNQDSVDLDFRVESNGNANMLVVDAGNDRVGIGTSSPRSDLEISKDGGGELTLRHTTNSGFGGIKTDSSNRLLFSTNATSFSENMRIAGSDVLIGKTATDFGTDGVRLTDGSSSTNISASNRAVLNINRNADDGSLINFTQAGTLEGSISVSSNTVSFNGGHLARWSQLTDGTKDTSIVKGTVMTNLDQMAVWSHDAVAAQDEQQDENGVVIKEAVVARDAYTEDNEQLNCTAVSSVEGDVNVAGVFVSWDDEDDFNDFYLGMTGDMVIRIASGTTVARGDLLMSAGDGTAKPQGDDIVRSKTIAKVTSTTVSKTYDDGTYLVPCVLMAC